jgi:hypothetical protein
LSSVSHRDKPAAYTDDEIVEVWMSNDIADGYEPVTDDYIIGGSNTWMIIQVDSIKPDPLKDTIIYRILGKV